MADEILDSHEQGEQVRKWLEKNATSIVVGLLVGLLAVFGGKRWTESQIAHRGEAMAQYQQMMAPGIDDETFNAHYLALTQSYDDTPYAGLAALAKSERELQQAQTEEALAGLRLAAQEAKPEGVRVIASLRLARALIAAGQADEALRQIDSLQSPGFKAAIAEVRGDALAAKGERDAAKTAYENALSYMDVGAAGRDTVEMKVADMSSMASLAGTSVPAESAPPAAEGNDEPATEAASTEGSS